ncbi:MAG TPA: MliC family protein [Paenirhodobacter sp.]
MRHLCCGVILLAAPAAADVMQVDYLCERGARVQASYINDLEPQILVMQVEAQQVLMTQTISASGAFYQAAPQGQDGYFWRTKGDWGALSWRKADWSETDLLRDCTAIPRISQK